MKIPKLSELTVSALARLGFLSAMAVLVIDQATKWYIHSVLDLPKLQQIEVLPPIFNLTMVWNRGISFGLLGGGAEATRWFLIAFALLISGFVTWWLLRAERRLLALALGLVLGGAIGNLVDRFIHGAVFDFFDFSGLGFPWVFNVADSAISIGVALLVYESFFDKGSRRPS